MVLETVETMLPLVEFSTHDYMLYHSSAITQLRSGGVECFESQKMIKDNPETCPIYN